MFFCVFFKVKSVFSHDVNSLSSVSLVVLLMRTAASGSESVQQREETSLMHRREIKSGMCRKGSSTIHPPKKIKTRIMFVALIFRFSLFYSAHGNDFKE